jgi:hypothetical protein
MRRGAVSWNGAGTQGILFHFQIGTATRTFSQWFEEPRCHRLHGVMFGGAGHDVAVGATYWAPRRVRSSIGFIVASSKGLPVR